MIRTDKIFIVVFLLAVFCNPAIAQISPGDLTASHSHLEGMSNCTKCHILGDKVSNEKCLDCHTELKAQVDLQKGYHSSEAIRGKACVGCHNDHHGRTFDIIRFDKEKFDHQLTGYALLGAHSKKACNTCHKSEFITNPNIKDKKYTFLGLTTTCLTCHSDYHQKTLSADCASCHNYEIFKPAINFDHNKAKFQLAGKHQQVECIKCHPVETKDGHKFQEFTGIKFGSCTSCHVDVHKNQFGQDCRQCHSEESFQIVKGMQDFDHNKTNYKLEDKHQAVNCKSCHKTKFIDPLKHDRCMDCHADYHKNQFTKQGISPDCSACHDTKGFTGFSFTVEQHNESRFQLDGAHLATPCFACHKKQEKWSFRDIGIRCNDCHPDIHKSYINEKFFPDASCQSCHSTNTWSQINFDHSQTAFVLSGKHKEQSCRSCHFIKGTDGIDKQQFTGLASSCTNCHKDAHFNQFADNGITNCNRCHDFDNWKISNFDHSKTRFVLDGQHKNVACKACHKEKQEGQYAYIQYKFKDFKCETCHR